MSNFPFLQSCEANLKGTFASSLCKDLRTWVLMFCRGQITRVLVTCCFCSSECCAWAAHISHLLISYYFLSSTYICLGLSDLFDLFAYLLTDKRLFMIFQCTSRLLMSLAADSFEFILLPVSLTQSTADNAKHYCQHLNILGAFSNLNKWMNQ